MARFRLSDQWRTCKTDIEAYIESLRALHPRVSDFFPRLRERVRTPARTFFARIPEDLYLRSPHLVDNQANYHPIVPGWYVATNLSSHDKERILIQACAIADVSYAGEFEIEFNPGHRPVLSKARMDAMWSELDAL